MHAHVSPAATAQILSESLIESYQENGFVHVANVMSREEALAYGLAAQTAATRLDDVARSYAPDMFSQTVNVWRDDEAMKSLTLNARIGAIAERLAGISLRIWHDQILIKKPHNKGATEFHQDAPYWPHQGARHWLTAWIALVDVPVERGCMTFIPGSQKRDNLRAQDLSNPRDMFDLAPDLIWEPRVTVPLRAGDCTFHHGFTAHMATPNQTDLPRVAHAIIYMDAPTRYTGAKHVVTDPLQLAVGQPFPSEFFPQVSEFEGR